MTTTVDIVNRALQQIGTRTTVTAAELANQTSNESIQANLSLTSSRDELLRMAPWNCATNWANLTFITSTPGTPENTTSGTTTWAKGQPPPGWSYEYQYPVDCLRPLMVVPQYPTGFAGAIPITTAVTGFTPAFWTGPAVKFRVGIDQFWGVTAAAVAAGGTGHAVGDLITLATTPAGSAPIGAPVILKVETVAAGVILTVSVINLVLGSSPNVGGSYFNKPTNPVAQSSTTGSGTGATFTLTFTSAQIDQRVILTNQENATISYLRQVTDPNVMDPLFLNAWNSYLAAQLAFALTGDKGLANLNVQMANQDITEARKADGNEGLTINDVTPDWLRARGISYPGWEYSPDWGFDWGPLLSTF